MPPTVRSGRRRAPPLRVSTGSTPQAQAAQPRGPEPARPLRSLPLPAPLAMPAQDLRRAPAPMAATSGSFLWRRVVVLGGALAIAGIFGGVLIQVLGENGLTPMEWFTLILSSFLSGWVGLGCLSAVAGFFVAASERTLEATAPAAVPERLGRTAILLPTYNEDPGMILAAVEAIAGDLQRVGAGAAYDLFILSDTRDDEIARAEEVGLLRLRGRQTTDPGIYYRRRLHNTDKKSGNVAEWVQAHGGAYAYMLVLDADSLMTGETIVALTAAMDAEPNLGLLQTVPTIINAETPFARIQQFASRLYGPVFACGQQWWSGTEGNYWGHNAIIRVRAFAESAGLPHLPGRKPFGGHILSHDFVEAALLRRRGWAVRTWAALGGSYEETPPTLLDSAVRDRRWCQGNLQHARLLGTAGLHWVSRLHLLFGILAYLVPTLWFALIVGDAFVWPGQKLSAGEGLHRIADLFAVSLALLVIPKALALCLAFSASGLRRGFGGGAKLLLGFLAESAISLITTPIMMVMQTVAVAEVLVGRDSGWSAQHREGAELSRKEAWRAHAGHICLGVAGALGAFLVSKYLLFWASPVFLSLALSGFLSLHTSRRRPQRATGRRLFQIPEDVAPPPVVAAAAELRRRYAEEAAVRRRIDKLFREPAAMYEITTKPVVPSERPMAMAG